MNPHSPAAALRSLVFAALLGSALGCTVLPAPPSQHRALSASTVLSPHAGVVTQNPSEAISLFPNPAPSTFAASIVAHADGTLQHVVVGKEPNIDVNGIALHAYGLEADPVPGLPAGRLAYFQTLVERQLAVIDAAGHAATPL